MLKKSLIFGSLLSSAIHGLTEDDYPTTETELPTACNDLDDGYQWIRPIEGSTDDGIEYPNIYVYCNDGKTIIDPSLTTSDDTQNVRTYFSSFNQVTDYVATSDLEEHVMWSEWWLPTTDDTEFYIAEDCQTCSETDDYGTDSVYYLTGNYIGCLWETKGYCDMDPDTLTCYTCSAPNSDEVMSGLCTHMEASAHRAVNTEHDDCVGTSYNAEPSIGTEGEYCVCYKPESATTVTAAEWVIPEASDDDEEVQSADTVVEVYASDFATGTYRITQPGIYKVMEDIEFDMNPPDSYDEPNAAGAWWPSEEQDDVYSGADGSFVGPYSMGFFAGFAVESDSVTIDLNQHTLKMSDVFNLQQRWFAIIELGSKSFISGQGPGNFGFTMEYASNIVVKDGTLGRSSHHGIHGNNVDSCTLENLVIQDFEVGGIAINGFTDLTISNVEIGPVSTIVPVLGQYLQARLMLDRLRATELENPDGTVTFNDRDGDYTASDVLDALEDQMDIIFNHYVNGVEWDEEDTDTIAARAQFENVAGLPPASTVYGMFLNSYGASVFAVGGSPGFSDGLILKDIHIHGLYNDPWEVPRMVLTKGPFNDIMDLTRVTDNGMDDITEANYIGSVYTDAQYTIHMLASSWGLLGHSVLKEKVTDWIGTGKHMKSGLMRCNNDIMLHVTKGVYGLRMDSVSNVDISGVLVEDLQNVGELGSYVCGNYEGEDDGGHRNQNYPLQHGYTGTEVHAVSMVGVSGKLDDVTVTNIVSARGDAMAVTVWPGCNVELGTLEIADIHAGAYLADDELPEENMPNKIPRACAVSFWTWFDEDDDLFTETTLTYSADSITAKCLSYHTDCADSEFDYDLISEYEDCDETTLVKQIPESHKDVMGLLAHSTKVSKWIDHVEVQDSRHSLPTMAKPIKHTPEVYKLLEPREHTGMEPVQRHPHPHPRVFAEMVESEVESETDDDTVVVEEVTPEEPKKEETAEEEAEVAAEPVEEAKEETEEEPTEEEPTTEEVVVEAEETEQDVADTVVHHKHKSSGMSVWSWILFVVALVVCAAGMQYAYKYMMAEKKSLDPNLLTKEQQKEYSDVLERLPLISHA